MNITILNGNLDGEHQSFDSYITRLTEELTTGGHQVTFDLKFK